LRRFERDLLQTLGYGLQLQFDAGSGAPLQPDALYIYDPEQGALGCPAGTPRSLSGADLLALGADTPPDVQGLARLRQMMREIIRFHLGGAELRAWRVLAMAGRQR
jgi:DNA repair protein RecO (recombination protein O)